MFYYSILRWGKFLFAYDGLIRTNQVKSPALPLWSPSGNCKLVRGLLIRWPDLQHFVVEKRKRHVQRSSQCDCYKGHRGCCGSTKFANLGHKQAQGNWQFEQQKHDTNTEHELSDLLFMALVPWTWRVGRRWAQFLSDTNVAYCYDQDCNILDLTDDKQDNVKSVSMT